MFPLNGESTGYVLKPTETPSDKKLELLVISGYHLHPPEDLRCSNGDFTTAVSIELIKDSGLSERSGSPTTPTSKRSWFTRRRSSADEVSDVSKTLAIQNNGFNPVWNTSWVREIKGDQVAFSFIRFGVFTEEGEFCSRTVRVVDLNEGMSFVFFFYYLITTFVDFIIIIISTKKKKKNSNLKISFRISTCQLG